MHNPVQIKKILVPCDFSSSAEHVLMVACDLAQRYQASVTLFSVYEPPAYIVPPDAVLMANPDVLANQVSELLESLESWKKKAETQAVSQVHTKMSQGAPATEILRECSEGGYDLVVMGTHGRTGLRHVLIGSVAEKVVRRASCPVLTIRNVENVEVESEEE